MAGSSVLRELRFLPYRCAENALQAQVTQCWLDGARRPGVSIDQDRHVVALNGQRFSKVALELTVAVPPETLAEVLPAPELEAPPVELRAVVRCEHSRFRSSFVLPVIAGGSFGGRLELERDDLFGTVEITCWLVRSRPVEGEGKGLAEEQGARLASARPWEVRFDIPPSRTGEYLDIREVNFAEAGPPAFPNPDALYQLDCDGEAVILWLNLARPRVAGVLHSEGSVGRRARLRDVAFDRIYGAVWFRLFLRAAMDRVRLNEPGLPWQTAVLKLWLPKLYPECEDLETQVAALARDVEGGDWSTQLSRLDLLIQSENDAGHIYEMLVQEVEP